MLKKLLPIFLLLQGITAAGQAQQIGIWESQTAKSTVNHIEVDNDGLIWNATEGGLFVLQDGEITDQFTPAEGMYRVSPAAMTYDSLNHRLWLGYLDGTFEYYDIEARRFRLFTDITRADRYTPRGINALKMRNDSLFIATDFGVVVFNTRNLSTMETYFNLGEFSAGTRVQDIIFKDDLLFAATPVGIASGDLRMNNLEVPASWENYDHSDGLENPNIRNLGIFKDLIYAASGDSTFLLENGSWSVTREFENKTITNFKTSRDGSFLIALSDSLIFKKGDDIDKIEPSRGMPFMSALYLEASNRLYFGTTSNGTGLVENGQSIFKMPPGPYLNFFAGLGYDGSTIISGSTSSPGRVVIPINTTGYYLFRDESWESYNIDTDETLRTTGFRSAFTSSYTDDHFFFGSWGQGLAMHHKESDEITIFNTQNSPLVGYLKTSQFVVIPGLSPDNNGNMWVVSWQWEQEASLYRFNPSTEEWTVYPRADGVLPADTYFDLKIDSFNQKWITLRSNNVIGRGLLVLRTDGEENESAVRLTEDNGNLPHNSVNAIVQDKRGEIWIGTNRGVVRFAFPDRVIDGNEEDRRGARLINADTTAGSAFLLSTINATAIAVNAANEKWIGTEGDGLWLVAESGGRHRVRHHFTTQNSPLISNNITSLTVDDETGRVFIATDEGLVTYTDVTRGGEPEMDDLFIYPNPFSYQNNDERIIIDGLSERGTVRIISVDGRLVTRLETRGGRTEWDARDYNGNRVATGVYIVIAVDEENGSRGSGKVVIVR